MRDTAGGDSWSPESDFEGMSHAELHKLAQTGNPESVIAAGNRLSAAGDSIQSLSDALNSHLAGLDWTSSAGDAFRGWARQVVQMTDCVADYHKTIGSFTAQAGTALQKVRSAVPPVSASDQQTVQSYHRQQGLLHTPKTVAGPHDPTFAPSVPGGVTQAQAQAALSRRGRRRRAGHRAGPARPPPRSRPRPRPRAAAATGIAAPLRPSAAPAEPVPAAAAAAQRPQPLPAAGSLAPAAMTRGRLSPQTTASPPGGRAPASPGCGSVSAP